MMNDLVVSGKLLIFRWKAVPDMYVLIVDGAVLTEDMYAIKLIKWSKVEDLYLVIDKTFETAKRPTCLLST